MNVDSSHVSPACSLSAKTGVVSNVSDCPVAPDRCVEAIVRFFIAEMRKLRISLVPCDAMCVRKDNAIRNYVSGRRALTPTEYVTCSHLDARCVRRALFERHTSGHPREKKRGKGAHEENRHQRADKLYDWECSTNAVKL